MSIVNHLRSTNYFAVFGDSKSVSAGTWVNPFVTYLESRQQSNWTPLVCATAGWKVADLAGAIDAWIAAQTYTPAYLFVDIGINNVNQGTAQSSFETDLAYSLDALNFAFPGVPLYIAHVDRTGGPFVPSVANVNDWIDNVVLSRPWAQFGIDERDWLAANSSDGVHPTTAGYWIMAQKRLYVLYPDIAPIVAAAVTIDPPTLYSLGFLWELVTGYDPERIAQVTVEYRLAGGGAYSFAQDAHRSDGELVAWRIAPPGYAVPNQFTGRINFLEPDTSYDLRLTLIRAGDDDVVYTTTTSTKTPIVQASSSLTRVVTSSAELTSALAAVQPGEDIQIADGTTITVGRAITGLHGTAEAPIRIHGETGTGHLFDLATNTALFQFSDCSYIIVDNLNVDGGLGILAVATDIHGCAFRNITMINMQRAFYMAHAYNLTIEDNTVVCFHPTWTPRVTYYSGFSNDNGITVYGSGHDIARNDVSYFTDGIRVYGKGLPDPDRVITDVCTMVDVYDNYVHECADDLVELDTAERNVAAWGNRFHNGYTGVSTQPVYGGPILIMFNEFFNVLWQSIKPNHEPSGIYWYHNTIAGLVGFNTTDLFMSNSRFKNNLFVSVDGDNRQALASGTVSPNETEVDYNGYSSVLDGSSNPLGYKWSIYDYSGTRLNLYSAATLATFYTLSGLEQHGIEFDEAATFVNYSAPTGGEDAVPGALDLHLKAGSGAIDKGVVLANINDGYAGSAPDLGAYEYGT